MPVYLSSRLFSRGDPAGLLIVQQIQYALCGLGTDTAFYGSLVQQRNRATDMVVLSSSQTDNSATPNWPFLAPSQNAVKEREAKP